MRKATAAEMIELTTRKFMRSEKGVNDITELLLVAAINGKGMGWVEIETIVRKAVVKPSSEVPSDCCFKGLLFDQRV